MGRSQLQGSPWHYEYLQNKKSKRNSINCVFNNGYKCTCSVSANREKTCVGEHNCDDFERCSFSRPDLYKEAKAKNSNHAENNTKPTATYKNKTAKKSTNPKYLVERGNRINVVAVKTGEEIHLQVTDSKNPFYMKSLNSIVIIKGEEYRISEIFKR